MWAARFPIRCEAGIQLRGPDVGGEARSYWVIIAFGLWGRYLDCEHVERDRGGSWPSQLSSPLLRPQHVVRRILLDLDEAGEELQKAVEVGTELQQQL